MKKIISTAAAILLVCTFMLFAVASASDAETSSDGEKTKTEQTEDSKNQMPSYKIGEVVNIKTSSGEYKLTITNVRETNKRNEFADEKANRVVLISYEFENVSYDDDLMISDMDMKAYDKDNNALETYPATEEKSASAVGKGRKGSGIMAYALNNENNYIEMEHYSNMFNSSADCKFILEW